MPKHESEALILRNFNLAEQDKIVVFFSREHGIIKGVAKGARKFNNRFGGSLEPMSAYVKIYYYSKESKELATISNCDVLEDFFEIQRDPRVLFTLGYFSELIEEFIPTHPNNELLFRLVLKILQAFKSGIDADSLAVYFEGWFLKLNGLIPDFSRCNKCGKKLPDGGWLSLLKDGIYCAGCSPAKKESISSDLIRFLLWSKKNFPSVSDMPFTPAQIKEIRKVLQGIIIYHMERIPKSLLNYQ